MADFDILVGATPEASFTDLISDINKLFAKVNEPLQIKVEVANQSAISDLQKQISKTYKSANKSSSGSTTSSMKKELSALKSYYKAQKDLAKDANASKYVTQKNGTWTSSNANYKQTAANLNSLKSAYDSAKASATALGEAQKVAFEQVESSEKASLEAAQLKATEKSNAAVYKESLSALKAYYKAQKDLVKDASASNAVTQENGIWTSSNANYEQVAANLNSLKSAYDSAKASATALGEAQKVAFEQAETSEKASLASTTADRTEKVLQSRITAVKQYYAEMQRLNNILENSTQAKTSRNASSREAYSNIEAAASAMKSYESAVKSATVSEEDLRAATAKASATRQESISIIEKNGDATKTITGKLEGLASKFASWLTVSQAIMFGIDTFKKMVSTTIEVDTAMTELKKVTSETDATYAQFLDNASERATQVGASLSDVVNATADFARLGYNIDEASELADAATVYKNVGDGIEDISTASDSIIATMQAFDVQASDAMSIVDKFNEVGNNYAISSDGIGEALLRSAAAMEAAGNTLDETIALTTAANTVVDLCHAA